MKSISIKAKMLAVFALIALAMAVVAMIAIRGVGLLNDDLSEYTGNASYRPASSPGSMI